MLRRPRPKLRISIAIALLSLCPPLVLGCHGTMLRRIRTLEVEADRQAVIRLIHQYAHGVDGRDKVLLTRTFTSDAVAEYKGVNFPMEVRLEGFPAIAAWLDAQMATREVTAPWHYMDTHLVEVTGNRATLETFQHNRTLSAVGVYTVEAVRTAHGWRIQKLHLDERILDPKLLEEVNTPEAQERIQGRAADGAE